VSAEKRGRIPPLLFISAPSAPLRFPLLVSRGIPALAPKTTGSYPPSPSVRYAAPGTAIRQAADCAGLKRRARHSPRIGVNGDSPGVQSGRSPPPEAGDRVREPRPAFRKPPQSRPRYGRNHPGLRSAKHLAPLKATSWPHFPLGRRPTDDGWPRAILRAFPLRQVGKTLDRNRHWRGKDGYTRALVYDRNGARTETTLPEMRLTSVGPFRSFTVTAA
jgi:hypothetical protein